MIESMIVLAIVAIVLAIGLPQLSQFAAARAMDAQVSSLASALRLARSEAVKRGVHATVCISSDPAAASPQCSAAGTRGWADGWVVFSDRGALGVIDPADVIVRVQQPIVESGGIFAGGLAEITFLPSGIALGARASFDFLPQGTLALTHRDELGRRMCVDDGGGTRAISLTETCP